MKRLTILIILAVYSSITFASDCSPVNLLTEKASPFNLIPVYNQKKINICYAYSAAQMLDYYLIKNGASGRNVHPGWVALHYAISRKRNKLEIGHTKEALEALSEAQNCDYDAVSSALLSWDKNERAQDADILHAIEHFPSRRPSLEDNSVTALRKILAENCREKRLSTLKIPQIKKFNFLQLPTDKAFGSFIEKRLAQDTSPIAISYCSNVWRDPNYDGIDFNSLGVRDLVKKGCHYHESLIVGKKRLNNTCHYLVRNSWGAGFTRDNERLKCVCRNKMTGETVDDCDSRSHGNGQYLVEGCWIESETLKKNIGQITVMEDA